MVGKRTWQFGASAGLALLIIAGFAPASPAETTRITPGKTLSANAADPFEGTFSNSQLTLTLKKQGNGYTGTAVLDGQQLRVRAEKVNDTTIEGTYDFEGTAYPFRAEVRGDTMTLRADGETISLSRRGSSAGADTKAPAANNPALRAGEFYEPVLGLKVFAPKGWKGTRTGGALLFGSDTISGLILVFPHDYTTTQELKQAARAGIQEEHFSLHIAGDFKPFESNGIAAEVEGIAEVTPIKGYTIGLTTKVGTGVVIVALVESGQYSPAYAGYAEEVARGVRFSVPKLPEFVKDWQQQLRGAQLQFLYSYFSNSPNPTNNGYKNFGSDSQTTRIQLFPDGQFTFRDSNRLSIDSSGEGYAGSVSTSGKDGGSGKWDVTADGNTPILRLKFDNGNVYEYRIEYRDRKLFLNGRRYFWTKIGED
ncbi:MAG: hypothetical protein OHK0029_25780 [Armatimonadaceae bacterium]